MAWCLVKHRDTFTFTFNFTFYIFHIVISYVYIIIFFCILVTRHEITGLLNFLCFNGIFVSVEETNHQQKVRCYVQIQSALIL